MAQAWHRGRAVGFAQSIEGLNQPSEMQPRQASAHQFWSYKGEGSLEYDRSRQRAKALFDLLSRVSGGIEALPEAVWRRTDPFESYKSVVSRSRDPQAGAHLDFMYASEAWRHRRADRLQVLLNFADKHGLLGLFYKHYSGPILPDHKWWVAPDALFIRKGKLQEVDPTTEGKEYLEDLLYRRHPDIEKTDLSERLAFPYELKFLAKNPISRFGSPQAVSEAFESEVASWEEVKELYGCYVVLDKYSDSGVTLLSTREPLFWWEMELKTFPPKERLTADYDFGLDLINSYIAKDVSPRGYLNEQGQPERGFRCPYLLKGLYLMLYLDVTGGREIRKCNRSSCQTYYRAGPQSNSKYCSERCANAASTRLGRGQEP